MGFNGQQHALSEMKDYLTHSIGPDSEWGSAGGFALRQSLCLGSLDGVMDLLNLMGSQVMAESLRESGFGVSPSVVELGREAILSAIQIDLLEACDRRVDGFGLATARGVQDLFIEQGEQAFAAKGSQWDEKLSFEAQDFDGDFSAAQAIQRVMRADNVSVELFGHVDPGERASLILIAGQALQRGVQGFGFDGIPGKYVVSLRMEQVQNLHRQAARSVTEESARSALGMWVAGERVNNVSEWMPDSVQRLLYGSVSMESAVRLVDAISSGAIGVHAETIGAHEFSRLLFEQGFDVNADTVEKQAEDLGLVIIEPDTNRGQYVGPMVGLDHRAGLVKFNRKNAIELPFSFLAEEQAKPILGDVVRLAFNKKVCVVSVAERLGRDSVER